MKIYLIHELGWEYNDEYYSLPSQTPFDGNAGFPIKAYKDKTLAQSKCYEMNKAKIKLDSSMTDGDGEKIKEFYEVVELEVEDVECE